jgi:hypothetical protein
MKIECTDRGAEINNLGSITVGEIVSHIDSTAGMMMRRRTSTAVTKEATITKGKVEFRLAEKVGEDWGR